MYKKLKTSVICSIIKYNMLIVICASGLEGASSSGSPHDWGPKHSEAWKDAVPKDAWGCAQKQILSLKKLYFCLEILTVLNSGNWPKFADSKQCDD